MRTVKRTFFLLLLCCMMPPSLSWGEPLSWGHFKLTPNMTVREDYNDNILLTRNNKEDDFITRLTPGISLTYDIEQLKLSLDYSFIAWFYMHNSSNNEMTHNVQLDANLSTLKNLLFVKLSDTYGRVTIDQRRQVALDNLFVNTTDSNHFLINPYMEYPLTQTLKATLGYTYGNQWYRSNMGKSFTNHTFQGGLTKELSSQITGSLFYSYGIYLYQTSLQDYNRQNVMLDANYQVSPKFLLKGSFGYTWLDYKKQSNYDSPIWSAEAKYKITDTTSVSGGYSQNFFESVDAATFKMEEIFVALTREGVIPLTLRAFKQKEIYITENRVDKPTGVTATASYPITPKMTGKLMGTYAYYKFFPEEEKVHRYGAGLSFDYALRITTLTLGYTYNLSNSTIGANDYRNNIVWIQAKFTF